MAVVGAAWTAFSGWMASSATATLVGRLLISTAASAISTAIQKKFAGKPVQPGIRTEYTTEGDVRPRTFILGWYATGGHMVCPPMSHGKSGKQKNAYLTYVVDLGNVRGQTLDKVLINDEAVAFGAADQSIPQGGASAPGWWTRSPTNPAPPQPMITLGRPATTEQFQGKCWLKYYDGTQTAADPYLLQVYGAGTAWDTASERPWSADMVGINTCYAVLTFKLDREAYVGGLPRVRFEMSGIPLYDPRQDTTAGGSGPQRWANPLTWAPSRNGVVISYNILRGIPVGGGQLWGYGVDGADLPISAWAPAMNQADETVDGAPRWQAGFEVSLDREPAEVLDEITKVCCIKVAEAGGVWKVRVGPPAAPIAWFTDDDVLADRETTLTPFPEIQAIYNGVKFSYPEPRQLWQPKDAPARLSATWEAEDGQQRVAELAFPACPWQKQGQRAALAYIRGERRFRRHILPLPPEFECLEPLDVISWTSAENGYDGKLFEIYEIAEDPDTMAITVSLVEVDPSDDDWTPDMELPSSVGSPRMVHSDADVPSFFAAEGVALRNSAGRGARVGARLRWSGWDVDGITSVCWELRRPGDDDAARGVVGDPSIGETIISPGMIPRTAYEARISFVGKRGLPVLWTMWEPFTTPDARLGYDELSDEIMQDFNRLESWAQGSGEYLRELRDEIDGVRDGLTEIDWSNYSVHESIRRDMGAEIAGVKAFFTEQIDVAIGDGSSLVQQIETLQAEFAQNVANLQSQKVSFADIKTAVGFDISEVKTRLDDKASTSTVAALTGRVNSADGVISAQADAITEVTARTNRASASGLLRVSSHAVDSDAYTRIGLRAEATANGTTQASAIYLTAGTDGRNDCLVMADRFALITSAAVGAARYPAFLVSGGVVYMNQAMIRDGSITNAKIGNIIESDNFVAGEGGSGWRINKNGTAEFNQIKIRRLLQVASGSVSVAAFTPTTLGPQTITARPESAGGGYQLNPLTGAGVDLENGPGRVVTVLSTPIGLEEWAGPSKNYMVSASMVGATVYKPSAAAEKDCLWGWKGDVLPLTVWSGRAQCLRLRLEFWCQNVTSVSAHTVTWKMYEVS